MGESKRLADEEGENNEKKIFLHAYFDYLQEMYKQKRPDAGIYGKIDYRSDRIIKFDNDFYSDTNLLILAVELRVFNPFDFVHKARADPYF